MRSLCISCIIVFGEVDPLLSHVRFAAFQQSSFRSDFVPLFRFGLFFWVHCLFAILKIVLVGQPAEMWTGMVLEPDGWPT